MKKTALSLLVTGALLFAAGSSFAQNIAIVNGKPIPKAHLDFLLKEFEQKAFETGRNLPDGFEQRLREDLIRSATMTQAAEAKGLHLTPAFSVKMALARQEVLAHLLAQDFMEKNKPSDEQAKAFYDKEIAEAGGTDYLTSHILVDTEKQARTLLAELKKGASFEALAKKHSKDPGSGKNGGDLGWSSPSAYVQPFAQAIVQMKKGDVSPQPVRSQFGYHIIQVRDTRPGQVPAFADVKEQIKLQISQDNMKNLDQYLKDLREKARVQ